MKQNRSKQMVRSRRLPAGGVAAAALVAVLSAGLATTAQAAATTVTMGTAGRYAVLAGSGITNTGKTTIDGDVGSYPTPSETGFGPCPGTGGCVVMTGGANEHGNAVTQIAKHDLTAAYNEAAGEGPSKSISTIGGGETLYAGVYNSGSSIALNGALTLNGRGNKDAVFVFQAGSTLVGATSSSVNLVNGAQACNVFWQVGSAATLQTSASFQGTIFAHDDISLGATVTVTGRLLAGEQASGAGAVTLINDTINRPTCAATPTTTTTTTTAPKTTTTTSGAATTTTVATNHGNHHKTTGTTTPGGTGTTTPGSSTSPSRTPKGAPQTGGGSTAGMHEMGLFGLGGALLLGGTSALVYRRRRPVS